jgi:hypothetical protein
MVFNATFNNIAGVSTVTFVGYAHSQMIENPNNLSLWEPKGIKLRLPMHEGDYVCLELCQHINLVL